MADLIQRSGKPLFKLIKSIVAFMDGVLKILHGATANKYTADLVRLGLKLLDDRMLKVSIDGLGGVIR